jgi:hypothetical protein
MLSITGAWISDKFSWEVRDDLSGRDELIINVVFFGKLTKRESLAKIEKRIAEKQLPWLKRENKKWILDLDVVKKTFHQVKEEGLRGTVPVDPEFEEAKNMLGSNTVVSFAVTKNEILMVQSRKIFLSHKGEDKKLVRRFQRALEAIGYEVWLDEKNLKAGDHLERGILQGFRESCAAVFFITDKFKDEKYLKAEIDYAIAQVREKENHFRIITLAFRRGKEKIEVPELLKSFVWKSPASELDALTEIIKALPIAPKHFDFKS